MGIERFLVRWEGLQLLIPAKIFPSSIAYFAIEESYEKLDMFKAL